MGKKRLVKLRTPLRLLTVGGIGRGSQGRGAGVKWSCVVASLHTQWVA